MHTATDAALLAAGVRPKSRRRTAKGGTAGFSHGHVNEAIAALKGLHWAVEDDCVSFMAGVILRDGDYYRVVTWRGEFFRGATTPRVAILAWRQGMRIRRRPMPDKYFGVR